MSIAFDSAIDGGNNASASNNLSFSFTNTAGNYMEVLVTGDIAPVGNDDVASVTYNSVPLTLLLKNVNANNNRYNYRYFLESPPTGANTVTITCTNTHFILAGAVSYSGCATTGQPDNSSNAQGGTLAQGITSSITPSASNCWATEMGQSYTGAYPTETAPDVLRANDLQYGTWGFADSNGTVAAGSPYSMTMTWGAPAPSYGNPCAIMATLAPPSAPPATTFIYISRPL